MKLIKNILVYTIVINIIKSISISSKWDKADTLSQDERIESPNGTYFAIIQNDGNFVVYSKKGKNGKDRDNPTWNSNTVNKGTGPYKVVTQKDGNLVLYDSKNKPTWNSDTFKKGTEPYNLIMQNDGNLVLYDKNNNPTWNSNTQGKK